MRLLLGSHFYSRDFFLALVFLVSICVHFPLMAEDAEKILFLVVEEDGVVASNTRFGRFDRLKMSAKEKVVQHKVDKAVAVVITNQRYIAYGAFTGGWNDVRIKAQEKVEALEAEDYSVLLVTSDRILNFYGRTGVWSETRR